MSWIESAPAHIPAIRLIVLRSAFAPLSVGTKTCADTKPKGPADSASAMSGTRPADAIRFGSSNASEPDVRLSPHPAQASPVSVSGFLRSLRRREDPLAQTPYVILGGTPTHGVPHERIVLGSVHHDATARGRSHLLPRFGVQLVPRFRCLGHRVLHRLTRPTSAPFRVGQRPYPAGYPGRPLEERSPRPGFPTPFGCRHSLLGPSHSR